MRNTELPAIKNTRSDKLNSDGNKRLSAEKIKANKYAKRYASHTQATQSEVDKGFKGFKKVRGYCEKLKGTRWIRA